jgi:(R,R)-butanediol dehydrogenase/meso-butanediol dehydrogenase/diacetyl reductase
VLPERLVLRIDPAIDPRAGAMTEPLAVALHAIRRLGVPAGEPVLVAGCGTIGGLIAFCLSLQHQGPVLVADRNRDRAALVAGLAGASAIELTPGALSSIGYVFEATGNLQLLERLVENARSGGGIALVGISHGRLALDPNLLVEKETALIGCHAFASADLVAAAALVSQHAPRLLGLIAGQYSLDAVPAAYQNILSQKSPGLKSIVLPHD